MMRRTISSSWAEPCTTTTNLPPCRAAWLSGARSFAHAGLPLADPDRPLLGVLRLGQRQRQDALLVLRVRVLRVDVGRQHRLLAELPATDALVEGPRPFRRRRLDRTLQRHHVLT